MSFHNAIPASDAINSGLPGTGETGDSTITAAPYSELTTLGSPVFSWNGGATSFIQYNSCWANIWAREMDGESPAKGAPIALIGCVKAVKP